MKIAQRATVSQEFIDLMLSIYKNKLHTIKTKLDEVHPRMRQVVLNEHRMIISKLVNVVSDPKALDFEITRLRALNYQKYEVRQNSSGRKYLCGLSFPIKLKLNNAFDYKRTFDMGPYWVCVPVVAFGYEGNVGHGSYHFYPDKEPMSRNRHPHHTTSNTDISIVSQNPLDMNSGTCFGGFNSIIYSLADKADIVEYFRSVYIYLNRIDTGSLLGSSRAYNYGFATEVV